MHIVHISMISHWGGGEQQLVLLYKALLDKGIQQTLVCPENSALADYAAGQKWQVITMPRTRGFHPWALQRFIRLIHRIQPTLLHLHDAHSHSLAVIASYWARWQIPMFVHRKVDSPSKNTFFSRLKYRHPMLKSVICVSNTVRGSLLNSVPSPDLLVVIPDSIDLREDQKAPSAEIADMWRQGKTHLVVNIGSLLPVKRQDVFLHICKLLVDRGVDAHFLLVGEGKCRKSLEALQKSLGLESHVTLTGHRQDVAEILAVSDILVHTGSREGFGSILLEAMNSNTAIVASDLPAFREIIRSRWNGILVNKDDHQAFAEEIMDLLQPGKRQILIEHGKDTVQAYNTPLIVERILSLHMRRIKTP